MAEENEFKLTSLSVDQSQTSISSQTDILSVPSQLSQQKSRMLIKKIDQSLARYYEAHDRDDYVDNDGNGMFFRYCSINGYDDETVDEELKADPEDCFLLDFDDTDGGFPVLASPSNITHAAFAVLKKCYDTNNVYANINFAQYDFKVSYNDFKNLDQDLIDELRKMYQKHCSVIYNASGKSEALLKLLAIGKNLRQPYFVMLADMFYEDVRKMNNHPDKVKYWTTHNKHCLELNRQSGDTKCSDIIYDALTAWTKIFKPYSILPFKIIDHIERIFELIAMGMDFVVTLAEEGNVPFQWDYCIAFNKSQSLLHGMTDDVSWKLPAHYVTNYDDTDTDTDDDDDIDPENDANNVGVDALGPNMFQRIQKKKLELNKNELISKERVLNAYIRETIAKSFVSTYIPLVLRDMICDYVGELLGYWMNYKKQFNDYKELVCHSNSKKAEYPINKRFCTFVDNRDPANVTNYSRVRRGNDKIRKVTSEVVENDNIEVIFFEPTLECRDFLKPEEKYGLWCFESSARFLLPAPTDLDVRFSHVISTRSCMRGQMMTLSFHCYSKDEIRCYLYLNGKMTRFFPQDMMDLLVPIFVENEKNEEFIKKDALKQMIEKMSSNLRDQRFRVFYEKNH